MKIGINRIIKYAPKIGFEISILSLWLCMLLVKKDIHIKYSLFFLMIALIVLFTEKKFLKFSPYRQPILIISALIVFSLLNESKFILLNYMVPWNITLLFVGILFFTLMNWHSESMLLPTGDWINSLKATIIFLIGLSIILYIPLAIHYHLKFSIFISLIKTIFIYSLLSLMIFYFTSDKKKCFRMVLAMGITNMILLVL